MIFLARNFQSQSSGTWTHVLVCELQIFPVFCDEDKQNSCDLNTESDTESRARIFKGVAILEMWRLRLNCNNSIRATWGRVGANVFFARRGTFYAADRVWVRLTSAQLLRVGLTSALLLQVELTYIISGQCWFRVGFLFSRVRFTLTRFFQQKV